MTSSSDISSSSNNRTAGKCDAVMSVASELTGDDLTSSPATGPLRVPIEKPDAFVEEFNRIYGSIGLIARLLQSPESNSAKLDIGKMDKKQGFSCQVLRQKSCVPCEGGVPVVDAELAALHLQAIPGWSMDVAGKMISRKINAGNFVKAMKILQRIAELAEKEQHHPDLHLTGYRHVRVDLTTHAIGGLSENDFIVAAKIDQQMESQIV